MGTRPVIAGGTSLDKAGETGTSRTARLYDPVANAWTRLPSMPEGRDGGVTLALTDGSVLLVGGNDTSTTTAVRFVPSP